MGSLVSPQPTGRALEKALSCLLACVDPGNLAFFTSLLHIGSGAPEGAQLLELCLAVWGTSLGCCYCIELPLTP